MSSAHIRNSLPTEKQLIEFIKKGKRPISRRELVKHFKLTTSNRRALGVLLENLVNDGKIHRGRGKNYFSPDHVPSVSILQVTGLDDGGEPILKLADKRFEKSKKKIYVNNRSLSGPAPGVGDRVLAKLEPNKHGFSARVIKVLESSPNNFIGVFNSQSDCGLVDPSDRRLKATFIINNKEINGASDGDLVQCETVPGYEIGHPHARILKSFGNSKLATAIIPAIIAKHEIPYRFNKVELVKAKQSGATSMKNRVDLRHIPFVTVDDETARDFDDAVWAQRTPNDNGWHILIAIADVSSYVTPGDPLDKVARDRGNSVYFPNTVIPMLPEDLSNGWCSLVPNEDRPCLAVDILIDDQGNKQKHKFIRCMIRSAARLTYSEVQDIHNRTLEPNNNISNELIENLFGAFFSLNQNKNNRGTINFDRPEHQISLSKAGSVLGIGERHRLDSHRLIEEFMVLANVCAAETLEKFKTPCMYRDHEEPTPERVVALRKYLKFLKIKLGGGQTVKPRDFSILIEKIKNRPDFLGIQDAILRCQSQAFYSPNNFGHFGLALRRYAHFTSPIRRYSDLLVHRALITALNLGTGGLEADDIDDFDKIGEHISMTERRAIAAERDAFDRLVASYLYDQEGSLFDAHIMGVERFGLFAEIVGIGVSGFMPISLLKDGYYQFDSDRRTLFTEGTRKKYCLGDSIKVRLKEVNIATGRLLLEPVKQYRNNKKRKSYSKKKSGVTVKSRKT
ncbi:MAG: ribonuclease R [Pseudomonadota bacterium]|nr:ribonuclease R [Pseudomonadota bacterium]